MEDLDSDNGQGNAKRVHSFDDSSNPLLRSGVVYGSALANHLSGFDVLPGVDESLVLINEGFIAQLDTQARRWAYAVFLGVHEIGHGLGFDHRVQPGGEFLPTGGLEYPVIYETFVESYSGVLITDMTESSAPKHFICILS